MSILKSIARKFWPQSPSRHSQDLLLEQDPVVESLEDRCLLSGNVRVLVAGSGAISLIGDGKSNHVRITTDGANRIVVEGLPDVSGQPTTINKSAQPFVIQGTSAGATNGELRLRLGGGNDFAEIDGIHIAGKLQYTPAGGHDSLGIYDSVIQGDTRMVTGGGNDFIAVVGTHFLANLDVRTAGGQDFIGLADSDFTGQAKFVTSSGLDGVYIADSNITGDIFLDTGGFPDAIYLKGTVNFNGRFDGKFGGFWDMLGIEQNVAFHGPVNVDMGPGAYWGNQIFTTPTHLVPGGIINVQDINRSNTVAEDFSDWITEDPDLNLFHLYIVAHVDRGYEISDLPIEAFGVIDYAYIRSSYYYQFFSL